MTSPIGSSAMSSSVFGPAKADARAHAWTQGDSAQVAQGQAPLAATPIRDRVASIPNEPPLARASFGGQGAVAQLPDGCGCVQGTEPSFADIASAWADMAMRDAVASLLEQAFSPD